MIEEISRFRAFVNTITPHVKHTNVSAVKEKLDNDQQFYLIDVREESEWGKGRLPQAIHLSKGVIERDIQQAVPDLNAEIVLYCGGGSRSSLAAFNLQNMGYINVYSMEDGFRGWKEAGHGIKAS